MPGTEPHTTVLVAGAAGSLGHRIAAALAMKPNVTVKALVRPASATTSDERDLRVAGLSKMGVELVSCSHHEMGNSLYCRIHVLCHSAKFPILQSTANQCSCLQHMPSIDVHC